MKILIYGAGIIGCVYGSRLFESDKAVTILARGQKYEDLTRNGISINNRLTGVKTTFKVPIIKILKPSDSYDLIIVTVRLDQLEDAIADLRENMASSLIMFMLNNPNNIQKLTTEFPNKHVVMGFPGVGGTWRENEIDYVEIKQQKTTIGEIHGEKSETIINLKSLFESAGFRTEITLNIQDWLKTHAVFIGCITASIVKADGDSVKLGKNKASVRAMVESINEGFMALESLDISIEPSNLKVIFMTMPKWFSIWYWQKAMRSNLGKLAIAPHAMVATEEMKLVAEKIMRIVNSSAVSTPSFDNLIGNFIAKTH